MTLSPLVSSCACELESIPTHAWQCQCCKLGKSHDMTCSIISSSPGMLPASFALRR